MKAVGLQMAMDLLYAKVNLLLDLLGECVNKEVLVW